MLWFINKPNQYMTAKPSIIGIRASERAHANCRAARSLSLSQLLLSLFRHSCFRRPATPGAAATTAAAAGRFSTAAAMLAAAPTESTPTRTLHPPNTDYKQHRRPSAIHDREPDVRSIVL